MKVNHAWFAVAGAAAAGAVAGLANSGLLHKAAVAVTTAGIKVTDAVAAETQSIVDDANDATAEARRQAKIDAAKEFVKFVCDDQTAGVEAVKTTGFFPAHEGWGDIYEGDETRAPFSLMSEYLGRYYSLTPGWVAQRALWWPMLAEILTTGADVQIAADNFVSQANANIG